MPYVPRSFGGTLLLPKATFSTIARSLFRTGKHRAIKAVIRSEIQHINATARAPVLHLNILLRSEAQRLQAVFSEGPMSNPYTTIDASITVTDQNNFVVPNLSLCSVIVTFPDGSTQGPLTATNLGNGVYSVTYTTKSLGATRELWNLADISGATAQFLNIVPVSY